MSSSPSAPSRAPEPRGRQAGILAVGILAAATIIGVSANGTLAGFDASITNSHNTKKTSTLTMSMRYDGGTTYLCNSAVSSNNSRACPTMNLYGGASPTATINPSASSTTKVWVLNGGSITPGSATLKAGTCTQIGTTTASPAPTDTCQKLSVTIYSDAGSGSTQLYSGTLANLSGVTLTLPAMKAGTEYLHTFVVTADDVSNQYQGLGVSQQLTWTFTA